MEEMPVYGMVMDDIHSEALLLLLRELYSSLEVPFMSKLTADSVLLGHIAACFWGCGQQKDW